MENRTKILFAIQKIIPAWMLDLFGYNASTMDFIINLGIPHVSEQIFRSIDTATLIRFRQVSKVWKIIIENVLFERYQKQLFDVMSLPGGDWRLLLFQIGKHENKITFLMKILLEHAKSNCIDWNARYQCRFNLQHKWLGRKVYDRLDFGASLVEHNARTDMELTTLMWACSKGHKDIIKLLLENSEDRNIDLNARTNDGFTAFIIACGYGREDIVKLFLDRNIDFNVRHKDGGNAFHLACLVGNIEIVRLLLAYSNLIDVIIPPKDVLKEPTINILESFGYTVESLSFDSTDSTEFREQATIYFRMMDMRCASYPSRWDNLFS